LDQEQLKFNPMMKHEFSGAGLTKFIDGTLADMEKSTTKEAEAMVRKAGKLLLENEQKLGEAALQKAMETCNIVVKEFGLTHTSMIVALILDLVKRNMLSLKKVDEEFGKQVSTILDGLLKSETIDTQRVFQVEIENKKERDGSGSEKGKKTRKDIPNRFSILADNFQKMILAISEDIRVILIRLAIRLYEMRHIDLVDEQNRMAFATETFHLYTPIAHKLGLYKVKTQFEEISMKYTNSEEYRDIARKLEETKSQRELYIEQFIDPLKKELKANGFHCEVKGRPKSIFSIWKKMTKQNTRFEGIYDLFAIRIILLDDYADFKEEKGDCWKVYSLITDIYKPNPNRLRDWISNPKASGYESLHTTVIGPENKWVEIQIRTRRMDEIAEKGQAAHWKYKEVKEARGGDVRDNWLAKMRDLLENPAPTIFDEPSNSRLELYSNRVFVFTPQGEIKGLEIGSTVLDFAYSVHTDLGDHCVGAKIDNRIVPLKYVLQNGERIEIQVRKNQKPTKEWLTITNSPRTKAKIKKALAVESKEISNYGRDLLNELYNELKKEHLKDEEFSDRDYTELMYSFNYKTFIDFFAAIGNGELTLAQIKDYYVKPVQRSNDEILKEINLNKDKPVTLKDDFLLIDESVSQINFELARCCNPIPGDAIFGFVTVSKGTKIHKINCPNATDMMARHHYRIVKAKWKGATNDARFLAGIHIVSHDRVGMLSDFIDVVSKDFRLNISEIATKPTKQGIFEGDVKVFITSTSHLDQVMEALKRIKGVISVQRVDVK
jgi:GTP diphosphokinase / guanosine-3',5'-bis(diphosphate) 3'-diphosphatase